MNKFLRVLTATICGAVIFAVLASILFTLGAILDGTGSGEAFLSAVIVGLLGGAAGGVIGFVVGAAGLGPIGGGAAGLIGELVVVVLYIFTFGSPGRYLHFLQESIVVLVFSGLPAILTGVLTALLMKKLEDRDHISNQ